MGSVYLRRVIRVVLPAGLLAVLCVPIVVAAQSVSRGYISSDSGLQPGMVVGLSDSSTAEKPVVERASRDKADKIIGIATQPGETLITLGSGDQEIYVQTNGTVDVFLSDMNGSIKKGDPVTISPLKGVLMRAPQSEGGVGSALVDFDEAAAQTQTVQSADGEKLVKIGKASISFTASGASSDASRNNAGSSPSALQKLGASITGKQVSNLQVVVALIIFIVVMVAEGNIIHGAVSSAMVSIGRNPLSKKTIEKELIKVTIVALAVLFVGLGAVYIILSI